MINTNCYVKSCVLYTIITLLLQAQNLLANTPNLEHESIDSILQWMYDNVETDTISAHEIGLFGLHKAKQKQDYLLIGDFHDILAYWHDYHQKFHSSDSVVYHYEQSLAAYSLTDSLHFIPDAQLDLAVAYMNNDQYEKARKLTFAAVEALERKGDRFQLAGAYNSLANLHLLTDEPKACIRYAEMSVKEFEKLGSHIKQVNSGMALIYCLCEDGLYQAAHALGTQNIALTKKHFPSQLGFIVRNLDRMAEASIELANFPRALQEANEMWEIAKNAVGAIQAAGHKYMIGKVHFVKGEYQQAVEVFEFISTHTEANSDKWEMNNEMAICYQHLGMYEKVYQHQQLAFSQREQVLEDKFVKLQSESFEKYESDKKDQELATQKQQLKQQHKIQTLSYGIGSLLLLMLGGLFFFFNKNKNFTNTLQEKNNENELLLKEIHHRVKNNLETVSALLTLQGEQIDDQYAKTAMQASQSRVEAMGLLHQKLYQGKNLGAIEMKEYFVNLSDGVLDSFDKDDQVKIELAMEELELDIDTAVPIGLIVNELLTNALKYAFPPDYDARIKIHLKELDGDQLFLEVADNGIGMTVTDSPQGTGFGTQLVNLLTKQLRGEIAKNVHNGTIISLTLKKPKAA